MPSLLLDIDGVISIYGWASSHPPDGSWLNVDGIPHFLSAEAGRHLLALCDRFDTWWCSGWEEKANEHLPRALGLPAPLPYVAFDTAPRRGGAHWKLDAIDHALGHERPLAWVDDHLDDACQAWAAARPGPTLLVPTEPATGLGAAHVAQLRAWADALDLDVPA